MPFEPNDFPDVSRVAFFDGQRLTAADLNDAATMQRELRWLHNRSLHTWGIALGFEVRGAKGDRQVQVNPGYAIDCLGREILLMETLSIPVPARAGDAAGRPITFYLVAAYPDDSSLAVIERRQGECNTDGAVRLREQAAIYWKEQGVQQVAQGLEVVLAQATVQNCQLAAPLSLAQRRNARPPQQPYVTAGETTEGNTPWDLWETTGVVGGQLVSVLIGVRTRVDTAGARFGTAPKYQAQLRGQRLFPHTVPRENQPPTFLLDGLAFVSDPESHGFTFSVVLPQNLFSPGVDINPGAKPDHILKDKDRLRAIVREHWTVVWVGVEG